MDKVNVSSNRETVSFNHRTDELIYRSWAYSRLNNNCRALRTYTHHILDGLHDIAGIHLLRKFVVWSGDRDDVHIGLLIFGRELNSSLECSAEQFVKTFFFEGCVTGIKSLHKFCIIVCSDDFNSV